MRRAQGQRVSAKSCARSFVEGMEGHCERSCGGVAGEGEGPGLHVSRTDISTCQIPMMLVSEFYLILLAVKFHFTLLVVKRNLEPYVWRLLHVTRAPQPNQSTHRNIQLFCLALCLLSGGLVLCGFACFSYML